MSKNKRDLPLLNQTRAVFILRPVLGAPSGPLGLYHHLSRSSGGIKMCHQHLLSGLTQSKDSWSLYIYIFFFFSVAPFEPSHPNF